MRAVADGVRYQIDGLDRRMGGKLLVAVPVEAVIAGISPDVGAIPAIFAKPEIVDMLGLALLPDEDQLMLGALEAAHAARALVPDDEVFQLAIGPLAGLLHFRQMPPIDALEVDRTIGAVGGH